jgi:ABC-type branched-subunit amino acid transport system substrate-binding protein
MSDGHNKGRQEMNTTEKRLMTDAMKYAMLDEAFAAQVAQAAQDGPDALAKLLTPERIVKMVKDANDNIYRMMTRMDAEPWYNNAVADKMAAETYDEARA